MGETSFGEWLKRQRLKMGLTQNQLAHQIGCATVTLRKIEAEERRPSGQMVARLAEILHIPPEEQPGFLRFTRGDWTLQPPEKKDHAQPWQPASLPRSNLPAPVTALIGREGEISQLLEYLHNPKIRLVTLVGPPGIGKTSLGLETARAALSDFPAGIFFVSLAVLDDASLIAASIAQALGYEEAKTSPAKKVLMDGVGDKSILIVLDNCEHLIESIAPLTSDLLSACPRLKILATSRESVRIPGEWVFTVPPLEVPGTDLPAGFAQLSKFPSLRLFAERARAVRSDFALTTENIRPVAEICARLDGLPLAIELIAVRMRLMSPQALLERLSDTFVLSADGMRAASARQKTLGAAIGWSYDFLNPEEQRLFASLAVFSGGFTLEAAESIFWLEPGQKTTAELITSLLDKSLLQRTSSIEDNPRFSMLVTIQQFAYARLREFGAESMARERHLSYFIEIAEQTGREIHTIRQLECIHRLKREHDNFRIALEWAVLNKKNESAMRLLNALAWFWGLWQHNGELRNWFARIREMDHIHSYPRLYAQLLNRIGYSNWLAGKFDDARAVLKESLLFWRKAGPDGEEELAEGLSIMAMVVHSIDADYDSAQKLLEQSLALYNRGSHSWGRAFVLFNLGWVADHKNQDEHAQRFLEESLEIFTLLGDLWGMGRSSQYLGQLFLKLQDYQKARKYYEQHLEIDEKLEISAGIVIALGNLGDLYRYQQDFDKAEQYYFRSLTVCREYGLKIDRGYNLYALGLLGLQKNDYVYAKKYVQMYFESGQLVSRRLAASDLCLGMAAVAGGIHQPERSARLYGAALAMLNVIDIPYTPFDRAEFERHVQITRVQLGLPAFEMLVREGQTLTMDEAIKLALAG